jgi:hypothetical protein
MSIQIFNDIKPISHNIGSLLHSQVAGMDIANKAIKRMYKGAGGLEKGDFWVFQGDLSKSPLSLPIV